MDAPKRNRPTAGSVSRSGCSRAKCWVAASNRWLHPPPNPRGRQDEERRMLQPARRKDRKEQKGRNTGVATRGAEVSYSEFGLEAVGGLAVTDRQNRAARRVW